MNRILLIALGVAFGCSPRLSVDWTKENFSGVSFGKIVIVGISENLEARKKFESKTVELLKKKGMGAFEGITIFPPNMTEEELKPENLIKIIQENNVDAVITMSLVDTKESVRYEAGENVVVPSGYYRYGNFAFQRYQTIHTPGYFVDSKSYLIEAVLHDLRGELFVGKETLVWTGQSSLVDPTSVESAANSFTKKLVEHVVSNGIIKANQ